MLSLICSGRPSIASASNNQTIFGQLIGQTCFSSVKPYRCLTKTVSFGQNKPFWPKQALLANRYSIGGGAGRFISAKREKILARRKSFWSKHSVLAIRGSTSQIIGFGQNLNLKKSNIWFRCMGFKTVSVVRYLFVSYFSGI